MCTPLALGLAVAGSTAVSVIGQNQAAAATNAALQQQNTLRKHQIDQAATAEINARLREMRREQARIEVAAGGAGLSLSSGSVEAALMDSAMQAGLADNTSLANRESRKAASDAETQAGLQSSTTLLGAGLKIGLAGGAAYGNAKASTKD